MPEMTVDRALVGHAIYAVSSTNLTGLGGPMGTERISTNWTRHFRSHTKAMWAAFKDYKKQGGKEKLDWMLDDDKKGVHTQDLGFVEYHVWIVETED
jgi:hypothetical protein